MTLNKNTSIAVERFIKQPPHAILLSGINGMGKKHLAKNIAMEILETTDRNDPRIYSNESFGIDDIREFVKSIHLKAFGDNINRVMIFNDADQLTIEAQTALLKLVEEPPKGTVIIFTSSNDRKLLATIKSRVQTIHVNRLSDTQIANALDIDASDKIVKLANGRLGLAFALQKDGLNEVNQNIESAKQWVKSPLDHRMIILSNIKKKEELSSLLNGLLIISSAALNQTMKSNSKNSVEQWLKITKATNSAIDSLNTSMNLKIITLKFLADASL